MKVNLFRKPEYEFVWPIQDPPPESELPPIPPGEKITIKCRRLKHGAKRKIEDNMIDIKSTQLQRGRRRKDTNQVSMSYRIGHMKDTQLKESVVNWLNVLDEDGNPILYTWDNLTALLACNADLDPDTYGVLETDLLDRIEKENSFADTTKVTGKNSPPSSSPS